MDSEELDRWLEVDPAADEGHDDGTWDTSAVGAEHTSSPYRFPLEPDTEGSPTSVGRGLRRVPWRWIGGVAVVVWLGVMAVITGGREGEPTPGETEPGADVVTVPVPEAADPASDPEQAPDVVLPDQGQSAGTAGGPSQPGMGAVGPATAALRARLTTSAEGRSSYLEWATPVQVLQLGAGIDLVVLDAIWLEGEDGDLDRARQALWAVPVADDGQVLSAPWPHGASPTQQREAAPPPVGTVRIGEVERAALEAGWADTAVLGSDPHPLVPGAVRALVEGTPPGGDELTTEVVWLVESADGLLEFPGAEARLGGRDGETEDGSSPEAAQTRDAEVNR